jgi:hypothetical protein
MMKILDKGGPYMATMTLTKYLFIYNDDKKCQKRYLPLNVMEHMLNNFFKKLTL